MLKEKPLRSIAFQNICGDGYSHVSSVPAFGIVDFSRSLRNGKG